MTMVELAFAEPPDLQTTGPIIYLADNLDAKDMLGYCIDTQGRGQTERIQLHSCKPDTDNPMNRDVLFSLNTTTGRIEHAQYEGFCLAVNTGNSETALGLPACSDAESQQFVFNTATGEIHPAKDTSLCLSASADSKTAGPYMSRPLNIETCSSVDAKLKTFIIQD